MSIEGEIFTQVLVAVKARRGRLSARKALQQRPLTKPEVLCTPCRNMVGAFVGYEPHVTLTNYVAGGLAQHALEHYGCGVCSTKLVRDKRNHDFGVRWRLI